FVPLLPDHRFLDLLAASDISLVTQQKSVADIVFPSKVITLMSSARAIVASVSAGSEVARVLNEAAAGIVIAPEDPGLLHDAIVKLGADAARRRALGASGRAFAAKVWERKATLANLEAALLQVAQHRQSRPESGTQAVEQQLVIKTGESGQ